MLSTCKICAGKVDSFSQNIRFLILEGSVVQERETIVFSCGCTIDFPEWQIDVETGLCQILNFDGTPCLEFFDPEVIYEEEDE